METGCLFRPAADLAGDTFGYRMLPDGRFAFYLADVAGHGVPAALNAFALGRLLRTADALDRVNALLGPVVSWLALAMVLEGEALQNAFGRFAAKNTAVVVEPVKVISWDHTKLGGAY